MVANYINNMLNKVTEPNPTWIKLKAALERNPDAMFLISEGIDSFYYKNHLRKIPLLKDKQLYPFKANGRKNVILLHNSMLESADYSRILFFLDREFPSQTYFHSDIFLTAGYSIENYYTTTKAFAKLLERYTEIDQNIEQKSKIIQSFSESLTIFREYMFKVGVILDFLLEKHYEPHLKKFNFDFFFEWQDLKLEPKHIEFYDLYTYFVSSNPLSTKQIIYFKNESITRICKTSPYNRKFYIRGKYEMKFLIEFLKRLKKSESKDNSEKYFSSINNKTNDIIINDWQDISEYDNHLLDYVNKKIIEPVHTLANI